MTNFSSRVVAAADPVLEACLASSAPIATLAASIATLRQDASWTDAEIKQVEQAVHERLVTIYGRD